MEPVAFEADMRKGEWFHGLRVPAGLWTVVRLDGRAFSKFTERFEKPFDDKFSTAMRLVASKVTEDLGGWFAYTESDEISILFPPEWDLFDRSVEKIVSISAGLASAQLGVYFGEAACFDSRIWMAASTYTVLDYFSWRMADAHRCALNGWSYWTLRHAGLSPAMATSALHRKSVGDKNQLLFEHGVNFNETPAWQRHGVGIWREYYDLETKNRKTQQPVTVRRQHLRVDLELPRGDEFRELLMHHILALRGEAEKRKGGA